MTKKRTLNTFRGKFICGDCEAILKTMPDSSIDLVLTSPPYADKRDYGDVDGAIPPDEYVDWFIPKAKEIYRVLKEDGSFILNISDKVVDNYQHLYVIGKQTSEILSQVKSELSELQQKHSTHESTTRLISYIQRIVETHHCECCDQDVDEAHVSALKKRLEEEPGEFGGLSPEETERMRILQIRQASLESMQNTTDAQVLKVYEDQLADLLVQIDDAKGQLKDLRDEISRYGNVRDLTVAAKENAQSLAKCYSKIDNLKEGIQATKDKIKEADIALASLEEKVRKAGTSDADLNLAVKKVEICAALHQLFTDGIAAYRDKLKTEVERDATELFCNISSDPDYIALKINDNYGLSIQHRSGEIIPFRSAGFEHIVALSLIGALHKNAPLSGPIIMDSPFGRLDPTHKKNITRALPLMSDQIILLAYTDEIDGQTARQVLGRALKKEYRLRKYGSFHTAIELQ